MHRFSATLLIAAGSAAILLSEADPIAARESAHSAAFRQQSVLGLPIRTRSNINNMSAWYDANGVQEINSATGQAGLIYPRSTAGAIFTSGLMWTGEFNDGQGTVIRTNGHSYNTGMVRGAILGVRTGIVEDPAAPDVRIWRIRRDYATADLTLDAAEIFSLDPSDVTEAEITIVREQYQTDWLEWPAAKGAPFYDSDLDGMYTPVIVGGEPVLYPDADEPGIAGGDQVIWHTCNDIGGSSPWGATPPAGLEQQGTIWAYNQPGFLGDMIFKRFRLIYKGTSSSTVDATIDNMYLGHWSDPDLGSFNDDFAGCDTVLNLGFAYNGQPTDGQYQAFGLAPSAIGYDFFQGPVIYTGNPADTAVFDLRKVSGAVNLPMTAFVYFAAGGLYSDPPFNYQGALQWNCMFQGLPPTPQPPPCPVPPTDPYTGQPAGPYWLYGGSDGISPPDPFTPNGWVDGQYDAPGDRRILQSSGPFTMALGDTQEIVVGVVGGSGIDWLTNVSLMKAASQNAQVMYDQLFTTLPPTFTVSLTFPNHLVASLRIIGDGNAADATAMTATVMRNDRTPIADVILYDDGTHGDETAGDRLFTNSVIVGRDGEPYYLDAEVEDGAGRTVNWTRVHEGIATVGFVDISSGQLFSDNLNSDGVVNPGENIRYGFTTRFSGIATLTNLVIAPAMEPDGKTRFYGAYADGQVDSMVYDEGLPESFFSVNIPDNAADSYEIPIVITDSVRNIWRDTIAFAVEPFANPLQEAIVSHVSGSASGDFEITVVDPAMVNDHVYIIEGVSEDGPEPLITLRDSTTGTVLFSEHQIPDPHGHNMPVTEGFKVMLGTVETTAGWEDWEIPQGEQVWTGSSSNYFALEGFDGSIGMGFDQWFSSSSSPTHRFRDVLIEFASTDLEGNLLNPDDTTASFAYRYLENADDPPVHPEFEPWILNPDTGIAYQDFQRTLPFAAWDISSIPPRRLAVGFMENNVNCGLVDGQYFPPVAGAPCFLCRCNAIPSGAREFFFIFDADYSETPDTLFQVDIQNVTLPLMWWGTPGRNGDVSFQYGDQFLIEARYPFTSSDRWTFNPTIVVRVDDRSVPLSYELLQNYPNPFNPTTTIGYTVPEATLVTMKVYNILGQEIRTLVDELRNPGSHTVQWDGRNSSGRPVASGVYFFRVEARAASPGGGVSFVQARKMLLIK